MSRALARKFEDLVTQLRGEPSRRTSKEWRFGTHGSFSAIVAGPRRGRWFDHEIHRGGDALELVKVTLGGTLTEAIRWSVDWCGNLAPSPRTAVSEPRRAYRADPETAGLAARVWREARPAAGTLVEAYLSRRGLALPPDPDRVLRFHPACLMAGERRPAMVGLLRDITTGAACGVHRTALLADGIDRDRAVGKLMLGRAAGAAIMLDDDVTVGLGLAEGIETALAVRGLGWSPIWAAGSAGAIARFPVLPGVEELTIFADRDAAGQRAARGAAARWAAAGSRAAVRQPRAAGADWADVAQRP